MRSDPDSRYGSQPPGPGGAPPFVIRRSREKARRNLAGAAVLTVVFVLPAGVIGMLADGPGGALAGMAVVAGLLLTPFLLVWAHLHWGRIVVTPDEIAVVALLWRRRRPRAGSAAVVRATVVQPRGPGIDTVFVLDAHRRVIIRVNGQNYSREDLDRLVAHLGLPCQRLDMPLSAGQLARMYPGIVSPLEARPYAAGCAIAVVLTVAIVILAAVLTLIAAS